jgi:hypothetical protein
MKPQPIATAPTDGSTILLIEFDEHVRVPRELLREAERLLTKALILSDDDSFVMEAGDVLDEIRKVTQ